jgi:Tfp pilus assembly protein PilO
MAANTGVSVSQFTSGDAIGYLPVDGQEGLDPELAASLSSVGEDNYFVIPVGMNLVGEYGAVMEFVRQLQLGDRLVLVHDLSLTKGPAVAGQSVEFSLTGQTFVFLASMPASAPAVESPQENAAG